MFRVGEKVQAVDELGRWETARVVAVGPVVVHFPGWDSSHYIQPDENQIRRPIDYASYSYGALQSYPDTIEWSRLARMRTILITLILLSSGHRSGVISQLRLGEFLDAREELIGGLEPYFVIKVKNHKTSATYGPVHIALTEELYQWCRAYMELARPLTPGAQENQGPAAPFFISRGGVAVDRVAQEVSRLGLHFGLNNLTPVNIRKTIASKVFRTQSAQTRARIAEHMAHQEATQAHYYKASNNANDACIAPTAITGLLYGSCATSVPPPASSNPSRPSNDLPGPSGVQERLRSSTPSPLFGDDDDDDPDDDEDVAADAGDSDKRVRASFTLNEINQIMRFYNQKKKQFSEKATIKSIVKTLYEENEWMHKWSLHQLYDKIRHTLNDE